MDTDYFIMPSIIQQVRPLLGSFSSLFTRERRNSIHVLQSLQRCVTKEPLNMTHQVTCFLNAVSHITDTRQAALMVLNSEGKVALTAKLDGLPELQHTDVSPSSPIIHWLNDQRATFVRWSELTALPQFCGISTEETQFFLQLGTEVLVPLYANDSLTGLLILGTKESGKEFGHMELNILTQLATAAAKGIESARLYALEQSKVSDLEFLADMKSEYILSISHQFKTPLSAIKASAEMLSEGALNSNELSLRLRNVITQGVDSLDRLVTELTEYGKMKSATLELNKVESNLTTLVSDTVTLVQPLADDKKVQVEFHAPEYLPRITLDPHRVQQIMSNIISNAIKFTPSGGRITIRVRREGNQLITQVKDTGPGIAKVHQPWVFEAFYGASDRSNGSKGSGLGLAIAKALTELHRGSIWLDSQEGEGSTFYVALPLGP